MKFKYKLFFIFIIICNYIMHSQSKINITIDGKTLSATLAENNATSALIERLNDGPITITMKNYGGFEKVGALPWSLPASDRQITTNPGDIMLYSGNNIVIFYGQNTWAYTPLAVLETTNPAEIKDFLGNIDKQVTFSLAKDSSIEEINIDHYTKENVYSLDGKLITQRPLMSGVYIIDKKKILIK